MKIYETLGLTKEEVEVMLFAILRLFGRARSPGGDLAELVSAKDYMHPLVRMLAASGRVPKLVIQKKDDVYLAEFINDLLVELQGLAELNTADFWQALCVATKRHVRLHASQKFKWAQDEELTR